MIPEFCITAWRQKAPWIRDYQIEQDLIISRALVNLYERQKIKNSLVFRGGTALNKLFLDSPARYSEDIDVVQIRPEPIGKTIDEIRIALNWLGEPTRKQTERGVKLIYKFLFRDNSKGKLKIEINTTEHFHFLNYTEQKFSVNNPWFSGETHILTYQLNELIGSKLKALYQRRKGRDLFDLWVVLNKSMIDCQQVSDILLAHCKKLNISISRQFFMNNLSEKINNKDFQNDVISLLTGDSSWSMIAAYEMVSDKLVSLLPDL